VDNDDLHVGRILTRREILSLMGITGAAVLAACTAEGLPTTPPATGTAAPTGIPATSAATSPEAATAEATAAASEAASAATAAPVCVVRPELTEGPFFFDLGLDRSDIRTDAASGSEKAGRRLDLAVIVSGVDSNGCLPLEGAVVDVWQCDADGVYSGTGGASAESFLRGYQLTDAFGRAAFTTIYPGWYPGRSVHIHFKIRVPNGSNGNYEFTSQFFFDDDFSAKVYTEPPYDVRGTQNTLNSQDGIYGNRGSQLVLTPTETGEGLAAEFSIALDLTDTAVGAQD